MKYKSIDQFKAMFSLSTLLAIYQSNAASARDTFFHDKKNQAMEDMEHSSLKRP